MTSGDSPDSYCDLVEVRDQCPRCNGPRINESCDCNECEELTAAEKEAKQAKCEREVE